MDDADDARPAPPLGGEEGSSQTADSAVDAARASADRRWFVTHDERRWSAFLKRVEDPLPPTPKLDRLLRRDSPFDERSSSEPPAESSPFAD